MTESRGSRRRVGTRGTALPALAALVLCIGTVAVHSESLPEALSAAYKFNPRLDAARATLRATDEEVPRAIAGFRPQIFGTADTGYQLQTSKSGGVSSTSETTPERRPSSDESSKPSHRASQ